MFFSSSSHEYQVRVFSEQVKRGRSPYSAFNTFQLVSLEYMRRVDSATAFMGRIKNATALRRRWRGWKRITCCRFLFTSEEISMSWHIYCTFRFNGLLVIHLENLIWRMTCSSYYITLILYHLHWSNLFLFLCFDDELKYQVYDVNTGSSPNSGVPISLFSVHWSPSTLSDISSNALKVKNQKNVMSSPAIFGIPWDGANEPRRSHRLADTALLASDIPQCQSCPFTN